MKSPKCVVHTEFAREHESENLPVRFQDVQTEFARGPVHVWVETFRLKPHFRWAQRVVRRALDAEEEPAEGSCVIDCDW